MASNKHTGDDIVHLSFKRQVRLISLILLTVAAEISLAALPASMDGEQLPSLAPVLEKVTPSVVNIYTQTRVRVRSPLMDDPFFRRFFNIPDRPRERISQSLGSGVIVDEKEGYVLTNFHVIAVKLPSTEIYPNTSRCQKSQQFPQSNRFLSFAANPNW